MAPGAIYTQAIPHENAHGLYILYGSDEQRI